MMRLLRPAGFAAAAAFFLLLSAETAFAWTCTATSRYASGWGASPSRATASRIALGQCAVRTPRGHYCRIRSCR